MDKWGLEAPPRFNPLQKSFDEQLQTDTWSSGEAICHAKKRCGDANQAIARREEEDKWVWREGRKGDYGEKSDTDVATGIFAEPGAKKWIIQMEVLCRAVKRINQSGEGKERRGEAQAPHRI